MKIYLISDIHLMPPGELSHGIDTSARFDRALDDLVSQHSDSDLCVIVGDLADHGHVAAYEALRDKLARISVPLQVMIGNHDNRDNFRTVFGDTVANADGFVQAVIDTPHGRLMFLDSYEKGYASGRLCEKRLAWIAARLDEAKDRPVYLFVHHPPFNTGSDVDGLKLIESDRLGELLMAHGNVQHIISGHTHRVCSGVWKGIPFTNLGATTYNISVHPKGNGWGVRHLGPINTGVMYLKDGDVVVHSNDVRADNGNVKESWSAPGVLEAIIARGGKLSAD